MLKITNKVTRYDIDDLRQQDYDFLKHCIYNCARAHRYDEWTIECSSKFLSKEDFTLLYQLTPKDIEKYYPSSQK